MIEVVTILGSRVYSSAEAETPEDAVCAARTLLRDARDRDVSGATASFYVDGRLVRSDVTSTDLYRWAAL